IITKLRSSKYAILDKFLVHLLFCQPCDFRSTGSDSYHRRILQYSITIKKPQKSSQAISEKAKLPTINRHKRLEQFNFSSSDWHKKTINGITIANDAGLELPCVTAKYKYATYKEIAVDEIRSS
ncbi:MAG: hypothetical protein KAS96_11500, partial [Planctomycetes bacterium]|nr:hypothetical protein [Planctomycetota bacterium]